MQEKEMVNDILSSTKSGLTTYTSAISECSNEQLRQTLQQMRNNDEQFQNQLSKIAIQKGYYQPAQQATPQEIQQVLGQIGQ